MTSGAHTTGKPEFLPAALELQQTPPSPLGQALLWSILGLFLMGIAWSLVGRVDIVVTASGRVIPSDHVKRVQPAHTGTIAAIAVTEGDLVGKGQALLQLDTTAIEAERAILELQLARTDLELGWRTGLERWFVSQGTPGRQNPADIRANQGGGYRVILEEKIAEFSADVLGMEKQLSSLRAQMDAGRAEERRGRATLSIMSERMEAYKTLVDNRHGARIQYLELLQQHTDLEHSLPSLAARERQLQASASALNSRISALISRTRSENLQAIARLRSERSRFSRDLDKALYIERQHTLRAPVAGIVEEMNTHTIGGVVTAGQTLMKIVPEGVPVAVEAMLENRDIGFVREGLPAEVKIETFNFTKYGVIPASITNLSEDAVEDREGSWKYKMRLGLEQQNIQVGDNLVRLSPGMTAQVEIRTGTRRIIEFLLSPLLRYRHESIRER